MNSETVLSVEELRTYLYTDQGVVRAVDNVSLKIGRDEVQGPFRHASTVSSVAILPLSGYVLAGDHHGDVLLWELEQEGIDWRPANIFPEDYQAL